MSAESTIERLALILMGYPVSKHDDQKDASKLEQNARGMLDVLRRERPEFAAKMESDTRVLAADIVRTLVLVAIDPALVEAARDAKPDGSLGCPCARCKTRLAIAEIVLARIGETK